MFKKLFVCMFLMIYGLAFGVYSEQVVVSQFNINLRNSSNYTLTGVTPNTSMSGISFTNSEGLGKVVEGKFNKEDNFTGSYTYGSTIGTGIIIPVAKNTNENLKNGKFILFETSRIPDTGAEVRNNLIDESFNLPVRMGQISDPIDIGNSGKRFSFKEFQVSDGALGETRKSHLEAYKIQEYMIRIVKNADTYTHEQSRLDLLSETQKNEFESATDKAIANSFIKNEKKYIDFSVVADIYDKEQIFISGNDEGEKIKLRFLPGNIEVYGLKNGKYRIEVYSLRYSKDTTDRGTLVVTNEGNKGFEITKDLRTRALEVDSFSTSEFNKIKATLITASNLENPTISVQESYNEGAFVNATIIKRTPTLMEKVYIDGVKVDLVNGKELGGTLYYNIWEIEYTATNTTFDEKLRNVKFILEDSGGNKEVSLEYKLKQAFTEISGEAIQTVFINTSNTWAWNAPFEIEDKSMNKYTKGYRGVKASNTSPIDNLYKNPNISGTLKYDASLNWKLQSGSLSGKSLVISKVMSDSKGVFKEYTSGTKYGTFYTTNWNNPDLEYLEESETEKPNVATFTWKSIDNTSFNTTLKQDKIIFRIVKSSSTDFTSIDGKTVKSYFSPYDKKNPIQEDIEAFTKRDASYVDLIFNTGISESKVEPNGSASFIYSTNRRFYVMGLPRNKEGETYQLHIYNLQGEDVVAEKDSGYDYRVLTFGGTKEFTIGFTKIVDEKVDLDQKGVFVINSKTYKDLSAGTRNVNVEFTTKARQRLSLNANNIISHRAENNENNGKIKKIKEILMHTNKDPEEKLVSIENANLTENLNSTLEFPLDIVFVLDNSASMEPYINEINNGISGFLSDLTARKYNVNYNLIVFGTEQNVDRLKTWDSSVNKVDENYTAIFKKGTNKWFTTNEANVTSFKDALGTVAINSLGGFPGGPENAFHGIYHAINYLNDNGRYLNVKNKITTSDDGNSIKSEKLIILLTDENGSTNKLKLLDSTYEPKNITAKLAAKLGNIKLAAIYNTSVRTDDTNVVNSYKDKNVLEGRKGLREIKDRHYYSDRFTWFDPWQWTNYYSEIGISNNYWTVRGNYLYTKEADDTKTDFRVSSTVDLTPGGTYYANRGDRWIAYRVRKGTSKNMLVFKDNLGIEGDMPSDDTSDGAGRYISEFLLRGLKNNFSMYSIGIKGNNVRSALSDMTNMLGIIQTWNLSYNSPFTQNDGLDREVVFSLTGLTKVGAPTTTLEVEPRIVAKEINKNSSRYYNVAEDRIKASLLKPHQNTEVRQAIKYPPLYYKTLVKENGKILLEGEAISQYREDPESTSNYNLLNDRIVRGTFIISGLSTVTNTTETWTKAVTPTEDQRIDGLWYKANTEISIKDFNAKFGKNPTNLKVTFIAETETLSIQDEVTGVSVIDKNPPVITDFKMTNVTLSEFMSDLGIFKDSTTIEEKSSSTLEPFDGVIKKDSFTEDKELNVKDGDTVLIEFTLDDESITKDSLGVGINYKQIPYKAKGENISDSLNPYRTKWTVKIPISLRAEGPDLNLVKNIELNIVDDNNNKLYKTENGNEPYYVNVFHSPNLLANTTLKAPTSLDRYTGDTNTEYYKDKAINANKVTGALAYLMVFDYSSAADVGAETNPATNGYSSSGTKKWISSVDGDFSFYEGRHSYDGKVYVMNDSGAISDLTHHSSKQLILQDGGVTLSNVINHIDTSPKAFYVDTIAPVVTSIKLEKTKDKNTDLNDIDEINDMGILFGEIGGLITDTTNKRAFKAGDELKLSGTILEKNIFRVTIGGEEIFDEITWDSNNVMTGKSKDLSASYTRGELYSRDVIVYDKAGNKAEYKTISGELSKTEKIQVKIAYDDRTPSALVTKATKINNEEIIGPVANENIKFTKDRTLPLTTATNGVPLSVVIVNGNIGDVRTGTGALGTMGYSVPDDRLYEPRITTYSYSGVGITKVDKIILDTAPPSVLTSKITVNSKDKAGKILASDLNNIFRNVSEMVGLDYYTIKAPSSGIINPSYNEGNIKKLDKALYSAGLSKSSNVDGGEDFTFTAISGGSHKFIITVYDRLGHPKEIEYIITVPNSVKIIGKTSGSTKQIESKVNNASSKIKVESRKE